jgi:hypothetical protein
MSKHKFDGKKLNLGSKTVANVRGDRIYEGSGASKCLANVRGDKIYASSGASKCLANVRKDNIYEGSGSSKKIGSLKDAQKAIDGPGGIIIGALWIACVR